MSVLDTNDPTPRYLRLATLFRQRIEKGQWRPGNRLPNIELLMSEFDVARVTVRQAITLLAHEGILKSGRGTGIEVLKTVNQPKHLKLETSLAELARVYRNDKPSLTLLEEENKYPDYVRPEDGLLAKQYRHLRRVHSRDNEPYCVISLFLDEDIFQLAPHRFRTETVIPVLLDIKEVKIHGAKQTLKISSADIEISELLKIPVNAPVAEVRRVFTSKDQRILYLGEITYRADYINFEMDLKI